MSAFNRTNLIAQINDRLPTNGAGQITAGVLRGVLIDIADSAAVKASDLYTHQQASAASHWVVNHNLGYKPAITVVDTGDQEVEANIVHTSTNQAQIYFSTPLAGFARCN